VKVCHLVGAWCVVREKRIILIISIIPLEGGNNVWMAIGKESNKFVFD
jgi:hypothetical protein